MSVEDLKRNYSIITERSESYRCTSSYDEEINKIIGRELYTKMYNPNYSKDELFNFAIPILEAENDCLKRILKI